MEPVHRNRTADLDSIQNIMTSRAFVINSLSRKTALESPLKFQFILLNNQFNSWADLIALDFPVSKITAGSSGSPFRETSLPRLVVMVALCCG